MKHFIPRSWQDMKKMAITISFVAAAFFMVLGAGGANAQAPDPEQSGSVGLSGTISAPPPTEGATISVPADGSTIEDIPVVVSGLCPDELLVKLFKNNVFAGSVQCEDGSFSLQMDLFVGTNELIARVFDDLDQPGPDSNVVNVEFADEAFSAPERVTLTSNFAKRGANPGQTLNWPVQLSGGTGPYAFSVDWGDGSEPDLFTEPFPGTIDLEHTYEQPGVYNVVVKAVDTNGVTAFLQLVGVANGPLSQDTEAGTDPEGGGFVTTRTRIVWWPSAFIVPFVVSTFWLGKRYMLHTMKKRIARGEHPFADI